MPETESGTTLRVSASENLTCLYTRTDLPPN